LLGQGVRGRERVWLLVGVGFLMIHPNPQESKNTVLYTEKKTFLIFSSVFCVPF
jgi:hypothetical protein